MNRYAIPIIIFVVLVALLAIGLTINPRRVPSPFIDKPAPALVLPQLHNPAALVNKDQFAGKVWVVNVWASWCNECKYEHRWLFKLAEHAPLVGLNKEDARPNALRWLRELGNPYQVVAVDLDGKTSLDWGVYGVPETFIMDKHGIVRFKQIGAIDEETLRETLLPLIEKLKAESS